MKKEQIEFLSFDDRDEKRKVGRPKLADKDTKKKSLIIAGCSFLLVTIIFIFGYTALFSGNKSKLLGNAAEIESNASSDSNLITSIKPLFKDVVMKENTIKKIYVAISPSNATNKSIDYISANEKVATVDIEGKVTAIKEGSTTITARTLDGSNKETKFNITVVKNSAGKCNFSSLTKTSTGINYEINCNNAKIKDIQIKTTGSYKSLVSKKSTGSVKLSSDDMKRKVIFKVVYFPNNSKISKYSTKVLENEENSSLATKGACEISIKEVSSNSCKYDISCKNATVTKLAYKIGNGSYIGVSASNLADTLIFEESDVTRVLYINAEYKVDNSSKINTITKSTIVDKKINSNQ